MKRNRYNPQACKLSGQIRLDFFCIPKDSGQAIQQVGKDIKLLEQMKKLTKSRRLLDAAQVDIDLQLKKYNARPICDCGRVMDLHGSGAAHLFNCPVCEHTVFTD